MKATAAAGGKALDLGTVRGMAAKLTGIAGDLRTAGVLAVVTMVAAAMEWHAVTDLSALMGAVSVAISSARDNKGESAPVE